MTSPPRNPVPVHPNTAEAQSDASLGDDLLGNENAGTLLLGSLIPCTESKAVAAANTQAAFQHLALVLLCLSGFLLTPYLPWPWDLARFRIWSPGDGVPIARMFDVDGAQSAGMAVATGGASDRRTAPQGVEELADSLGAGVAANLEEPPTPRITAAPGAAAEDDTQPSPPTVRIEPRELEGLVRELEDPQNAMRPFYVALEATARREEDAITRVAHYGDSSIASDGITVTMRRRFQQRFGDSGHGFILIARGNMPYRHQDVRHSYSDDWHLIQLVRAGLRDHRYGYGGVQFRSGFGDSATFGTHETSPVGNHLSRFELHYQRHTRGGRVEVRVDRGERQIFSTRGEPGDDVHVVELPDGPHRIDIRTVGGGESRLYGAAMEREGPGVVYDSLGLVGARARRMLGFDPAHFRSQHRRRGTHLVILGFGGNDADDERTPEEFERDFRRVIRLVRDNLPEAGCLMMSPLDQAHRDERGALRTMPNVPVIVEAQRRASAAEGCAFFDTFDAMGGAGTMRRWYRSDPRLAFGDYRHATPAGYQVIGNMLYKAVLKGFSDYLERAANPPE